MKFLIKKKAASTPPVINTTPAEKKKKSLFGKKVLFVLLILLIVIAFLCAGYFFYQYHILKNQLQKNQMMTKQQTEALITKVGKHVLLPAGLPLVYTVTDMTKLVSQPFFAHVANGDEVLIYPTEKEAILYSPQQDLVLNMGPLGTTKSTAQPTPQQNQELVRVGFRNGTTLAGLTNTVIGKLTAVAPHAIVAFRTQDNVLYPNTLVVVINPAFQALATQFADTLHAQVAQLPANELRPIDADILIIVGRDQIGQ